MNQSSAVTETRETSHASLSVIQCFLQKKIYKLIGSFKTTALKLPLNCDEITEFEIC